jgi:hypothetical protein
MNTTYLLPRLPLHIPNNLLRLPHNRINNLLRLCARLLNRRSRSRCLGLGDATRSGGARLGGVCCSFLVGG